MIFVDQQLYKNKTGIYKIENTKTHGVYIGQTSENFQERYWNHQWKLRSGIHDNKHLQSSWNKHGEEAFEYSVVEVIPNELLNDNEKEWIQHYRNLGVCYNIQDGGQPTCLNQYISPEMRKHIGELNRERMIGTSLSEETRQKMSLSHKGKRYNRKTDVLTSDQALQIKEMLIRGDAPSFIASSIGVPYNAVNNVLSNDSFKDIHVDGWDDFQRTRIKKRHGVTKEEIEKMQELYSIGYSRRKIANIIGCTHNTVSKYLKI